MKKFLLFFLAAVISCCLGERVQAKIYNIQDYTFEILDTLLPGDDGQPKLGCPSDYPISESNKPEEKNGIHCSTDGHLYDGKRCYTCTGGCDNPLIYPYTAKDCEGLSPTGECITLAGEKRYKSCCSGEYYEAKDLADGGDGEVFSYTTKTNTKKTITCYKPNGCASGRETISSANFNIIGSGSTYKATKKGKSCTSLTVVPLLTDNNSSQNLYCATGYICNSPHCKNGASSTGNTTCVSALRKDDSLSSYYDTYCYFYPGCNTDESNCFSGGTAPDNMNVTRSDPFSFWYPGSNKTTDSNQRCMRFDSCKSGIDADNNNIMYGDEYSVEGQGIEVTAKTLGDEDKQKKCYTYTCKTDWAASSDSGTVNVSALSSNGSYEVSYVQGSGSWLACRRAAVSLKQCFTNCSQGAWYNATEQDCDDNNSNYIYSTKTENSAILFELKDLLNKSWADLTASQLSGSGVSVNNLWNTARANDIKVRLVETYGEDHCYITKKNDAPQIIKVTNAGIVEINSVSDFETCQ